MIRWRQYLAVPPVLAATVLVSLGLQTFQDDVSAVMVYMLAVVLSSFFLGQGPSVLICLFSVVLFDVFNLQPFLEFSRSPMEYLFTFGVMLATAMTISMLADRLRRQVHEAEEREARAAALYALSADMASASDNHEIAAKALRHVAQAFACQVTVLAEPVAADAGVTTAGLDGRLRTGDGDTLPVRVTLPEGVEATASRRLHLQAMLEQASLAMERDALRRKVRAAELKYQEQALRGQILNALSHDMRTPLAAIIGAASSLLDRGDSYSVESRQTLRKIILEEARHMQGMVENLLDMVRLQDGNFRPGQDWQAIEEIVAGAVAISRRRFVRHDFRVSVPDDLPLLRCDPFLLERVLVNLLENAAKYSPDGSEIRIEAGQEDRWLVLQVSDQGPGIPESALPQVFDPFFRADPEGLSGMGLGLTLCRLIVTAHGGEITLETLAEGGLRARVRLPLPASGDGPAALAEEEG